MCSSYSNIDWGEREIGIVPKTFDHDCRSPPLFNLVLVLLQFTSQAVPNCSGGSNNPSSEFCPCVLTIVVKAVFLQQVYNIKFVCHTRYHPLNAKIIPDNTKDAFNIHSTIEGNRVECET